MVAVEDILTECLAGAVKDWFEPKYAHPFFEINVLCIPESQKPIPHKWVEDVQIDDLFGAGDADGGPGGQSLTWSAQEGRQHLLDSLQRLDLSEDQVAHPTLERLSRTECASEKRRVKQELKRYDAEFRKQFARLPTHTEKEPMRPLYVYYRRLKTVITQVEQGQGRGVQRGRLHGGRDDDLHLEQRESLATIADLDETPRNSGRKDTGIQEQIATIEARIGTLQSEKSAVRAKLQSFQEKFVGENNRKIRFHKDILPIEREYRMYKNLKEEIMKAEQQLRDLKAQELACD